MMALSCPAHRLDSRMQNAHARTYSHMSMHTFTDVCTHMGTHACRYTSARAHTQLHDLLRLP